MATMEKNTPRGTGKWKNRFGIGNRNNKKGLVILSNDAKGARAPEEPDNGENRSLMAKRTQRLAAKSEKKKGGSIIRKLQVKTSSRRESRDASDSSPSNPQSPYSNDSCVTVEVSYMEALQ